MSPDFLIENFTRPRQVTGKLVWRLHPRLWPKKGGRWHYRIEFDVPTRTFKASIFEHSGGGRGPRRTPLSPEITATLKSMLPPKALAMCTAATLSSPPSGS